MSETMTEITCIRCRRTWYEDLEARERVEQILYKGTVVQKTYRVPCPHCGTHNVIRVEIEEEKTDG